MAKHLGLPAVVFLALCCHLCRCQVNIDPNLEVELQFSVVLERNSSTDQLLANDWESESFLQEQLANVEAQDNEEIRKPLEDYLKGLYNTTIGYRNLTIQTLLDDGKTVGYSVDYNVKELSEDGSLADDGQLHADLKRVLDELDWDFGDFLIDKEETTNKMKVEIDTVFEVTFGREKLCDLIGNDICSNTSQCDIGQGQVKCQEKCERYLERYTKCNTASLAVVFVKGDCQLDGDKNPFCDCGKSPGDVLRNFFDGEQCVSAAFIVGFSATAGGVILVSLLSAVIALAVSNSNKSKQLKKMSEDDGPPIWAGKNGTNPSGPHVLNEYDNAGFQGNGHGHSFHEEASHDNHVYHEYETESARL